MMPFIRDYMHEEINCEFVAFNQSRGGDKKHDHLCCTWRDTKKSAEALLSVLFSGSSLLVEAWDEEQQCSKSHLGCREGGEQLGTWKSSQVKKAWGCFPTGDVKNYIK